MGASEVASSERDLEGSLSNRSAPVQGRYQVLRLLARQEQDDGEKKR